MYNSKSKIATEFIDDAEIKRTLAWAEENKNDLETIRGLLARAKDCKGLTYQEAMLLLECDDPQIHEEIFALANEIKEKF
jgi:2-iminoacetate synthase